MLIFARTVLAGVCLGAMSAMAGSFLAMGSAAPGSASVGQDVTFNFPVQYFNNEVFACGVQVDFGDGSPPRMDAVKKAMYPAMYSVKHAYAKPSAGQPSGGKFIATLTPHAQPGMVACLGSGTTAAVAVIGNATVGTTTLPPAAMSAVSNALTLAVGTIKGLVFTKKVFDPKEPIAYTVQGSGAPCNFSVTFQPNLSAALATAEPGGPPPPPPPPSPPELSFPKSGQLPLSATQNEGVGAGIIKPWVYTVVAQAGASDKAKGNACNGKAMAEISIGGQAQAAAMATKP